MGAGLKQLKVISRGEDYTTIFMDDFYCTSMLEKLYLPSQVLIANIFFIVLVC